MGHHPGGFERNGLRSRWPLRFPSLGPCFTLRGLHDDLQSWMERLRSGDSRALARAISAVENRTAESSPLLKGLFPHSGKARILGLTGPPGAGKSTLVDQLARHYRRSGKTLGIIAVDPTSPYTGGGNIRGPNPMSGHSSCSRGFTSTIATLRSLRRPA